jgi:formylmethanofuran dehydrogenase subunit B
MKLKATAEQLQARLGRRFSNAARRHKNKKKFHKADRRKWRKAEMRMSVGKLKEILDQANHQALWMGAKTTLETLMSRWTDDNEFNREMVEGLHFQALMKVEGLS